MSEALKNIEDVWGNFSGELYFLYFVIEGSIFFKSVGKSIYLEALLIRIVMRPSDDLD
jgi:hypothetical protein